MKQYYTIEGIKRNNLGDIIQGLVAKTYLDDYSECIDREKLNIFDGNFGLFICNGWFMHNYKAFPPSQKLLPFYISFHLASVRLLTIKSNRKHFRKYAPIGCRDRKTQMLFILNGIPAYYSGCLTVNFDKVIEKRIIGNQENIIMVDNINHEFPLSIINHITSVCNEKVLRFSHNPITSGGSFDEYFSLNQEVIKSNFEAFQDAKFIITNKLHCAIPCLSLNIKVIFIHPNPNDVRLDPLKEFIPIYSYNDVLKWDAIPRFKFNRKRFLRHKNRFDFLISRFLKDGKNPYKLPANIFSIFPFIFMNLMVVVFYILSSFYYLFKNANS